MDRKRSIVFFGLAACLALAACSGESSDTTPKAVTDELDISFDDVADYAPSALPAYFDDTVEALDNAPPADSADNRKATLGRVLFYDLRLSTNDRASCASCHQQRFGFTDPMRFSNGISSAGTTDAHSMRLGNLRYWQPGSMFWDRRVDSVEAQVSHPIHNLVELGWGGPAGGMNDLIRKLEGTPYYPPLFKWAFGTEKITEERMQQALAYFVRGIVASHSKWDEGYAAVFSKDAPDRALDRDLPNFTAQENRGRHMFMTSVAKGGAGCATCHVPPTFALSPDARSNGLDAGETRLFKAPSLRNVGLTGPYMHDGRFATLAEVIDFYDSEVRDGPALDPRLKDGSQPQRLGLSPKDRDALVAFLQTLTDNVVVKDKRFADPFRNRPAVINSP